MNPRHHDEVLMSHDAEVTHHEVVFAAGSGQS